MLSHRIHVFAGDYQKSKPALESLDKFIASPDSFFNRYRAAKGVQSATVFNKIDTRHIESDTRDPNFNPFFVRTNSVASRAAPAQC